MEFPRPVSQHPSPWHTAYLYSLRSKSRSSFHRSLRPSGSCLYLCFAQAIHSYLRNEEDKAHRQKPNALARSLHRARMHAFKHAIHANGEKEIVGFAVRIAGSLDFIQTSGSLNSKILIRLKSADYGKRNLEVVPPILHRAIAAHLIDVSIEDHHFPVKMFESSQAEVAVGEQRL